MVVPGPGPRWAGRLILAFYAWGFVSATVIMVALLARSVVRWCREKGGWRDDSK